MSDEVTREEARRWLNPAMVTMPKPVPALLARAYLTLLDERDRLREEVADSKRLLSLASWVPPDPDKRCAFCGCPQKEYVEDLEGMRVHLRARNEKLEAVLETAKKQIARIDDWAQADKKAIALRDAIAAVEGE